jgi:hypothetical protein
MADKFRKLNADEIEVRVKQVGEKGATALLYKTARTDMQLLDETVGADAWSCDYKEIKGNLFCGITIDGVTKWDCGIESREDNEGNEKKGEASDAFKRAGFRWGIGRELYTSPFIWLNTKTEKNSKGAWVVSDFATFSVKSIGYEGNRISSLSIVDDKSGSTVYTFPRGGKRAHDEPKEETPASVAVETEKMREIILDLAKSAGRDEQKTRMFAEGYIERVAKEFIPWDNMTIGHLASVKVELAKRIAAPITDALKGGAAE